MDNRQGSSTDCEQSFITDERLTQSIRSMRRCPILLRSAFRKVLNLS